MANQDFTTKFLATLGELAVIAALFPYQITVNRKEKSFSARSFLLHMRSEKKEDELGRVSRDLTFRMPGFVVHEAAKKLEKTVSVKKPKKKLILRRRAKNSKSED